MHALQTTKRAFTLVELLVTMGLTALVLSATTSLYIFSANTASKALTTYTSYQSSLAAMDRVSTAISHSLLVETMVAGKTFLKLTMPVGRDIDGDSVPDRFHIYSPLENLSEAPRKGERWWFYLSDNTGRLEAMGDNLWLARTTNDSFPTDDQADPIFALNNQRQPRYPNIREFSATIDETARLIELQVEVDTSRVTGGSTVAGQEPVEVVRFDRQVFARNWR